MFFNEFFNRVGLIDFNDFPVCGIVRIFGANCDDICVRGVLILDDERIALRVEFGGNCIVRVYAGKIHVVEGPGDLCRAC